MNGCSDDSLIGTLPTTPAIKNETEIPPVRSAKKTETHKSRRNDKSPPTHAFNSMGVLAIEVQHLVIEQDSVRRCCTTVSGSPRSGCGHAQTDRRKSKDHSDSGAPGHVAPQGMPLVGLVDVDESLIACHSKDDPLSDDDRRSHQGKLLVASAVEVGECGSGHICLARIDGFSADSLHAFLGANLATGTTWSRCWASRHYEKFILGS